MNHIPNAQTARPYATSTQYAVFYLGRLIAIFFRLRTLALAQVIFAGVQSPTLVRRRFYDKVLVLDVARANPQKMLWLQGRHFVKERSLVEPLVQPGAHVVDVGANIGYYTLMFASLAGDSGRVWSIEPDPVNLLELEAAVAESKLDGTVTILPVAAGARDGTAKFEPGLNSHVTPQGRSEVAVRSLDSLQLDRVDFIKIDVEGYEGAVLEGALATFGRCKPTIFMELHPQLLTEHTHADILDLVHRHFSQVKAYHQERGTLAKRILQSYGIGGAATEISDLQSIVEGYRTGRLVEPCWIVGHN